MTNKRIPRASALLLIFIISIIIPATVFAGGVCGGIYIAEQGDTVE